MTDFRPYSEDVKLDWLERAIAIFFVVAALAIPVIPVLFYIWSRS